MRFFDQSWAVAFSLLDYFDVYRIGSIAPVAAEIEVALEDAYEKGKRDAIVTDPVLGAKLMTLTANRSDGTSRG